MFLRNLLAALSGRSYTTKTSILYDGSHGTLYQTQVHSLHFFITCNGYGTTKEQSRRNAFAEYNRLLDTYRRKGVLN